MGMWTALWALCQSPLVWTPVLIGLLVGIAVLVRRAI